MNIILKSLTLDNFAGSGREEHTFSEKETTVSAQNGVGKTRLENAFIWLLFDKNAEDRKDFNIKNTNDLEANRQDHVVSAVLNINGSDILLEKIYKEKHVKKQGSKLTEFAGNETVYFYDGVPHKKADYNAKIDTLINEDLFKLITNVSFFNKLPWLKQRNVITSLVQEVTDNDVANGNNDFEALLASLTNGKTMAEYKSQITSQKKKINEELKGIPVRIDEVRKAMPEAEDFEQIETDIYDKETSIKGVELEISVGLEQFNKLNEGKQAKLQAINNLKSKKQALEFELSQETTRKSNDQIRSKVDCRNNISSNEKEVARLKVVAEDIVEKIKSIDERLVELRAKFATENAAEIVINQNDFKCPTCATPFPDEDIEAKKQAFINSFNENKVKVLNTINQNGQKLNSDKAALSLELVEANEQYESAILKVDQYKAEFLELAKSGNVSEEPLPTPKEITELDEKIKAATEQLDVIEPIDQLELKALKMELTAELDALKLRLVKKDAIKASKARITELENKESEYSQLVFDLEGIEFNIANFDKAKINAVEAQVNAKFEKVKFKLFEVQVNGSEVPSCEATLDSVPYADCSTGQKIIMGLDIINTLSKHHGVYAPVYIDNSEAVTLPIETNCQVIKLKVLEGQKTLLFS